MVLIPGASIVRMSSVPVTQPLVLLFRSCYGVGKCDTCTKLEEVSIDRSRSLEERQDAKVRDTLIDGFLEALHEHNVRQREERISSENKQDYCLKNPQKAVHIRLDGMDRSD